MSAFGTCKLFYFSIHAVEHGINKYKKNKTGNTVEMMLLPVTLCSNYNKVSIEDQFCFMFEDILQSGFARKTLLKSAGGKCFLTS